MGLVARRTTAGTVGAAAVLLSVALAYVLGWGYGHLVAAHPGLSAATVVELFQWFLMLGLPFVIAYGGVRLGQRYPDATDQCLAGRWVAVGTVGSAGLGGFLVLWMATDFGVPAVLLVPEILLVTGFGVLSGLLVGWYALQARGHREAIETQRDVLAFLNRSLRHHVLNGINVIDGHRSRLSETARADQRESLETIHEQSVRLEETIGAIARLTGTVEVLDDGAHVDLSALLSREVAHLRERHPDADIAADVPSGLVVRGDDTLGLVLRHILVTALETNPTGTPSVCVRAAPTNGDVGLTIADNSPALSDRHRETLFEDASRGDEPAGLYMARAIVGHFGGTISARGNADAGTTISITIPR